MTYEIVDSRNNVVIDIANSAEEAEDMCEAWNLLDETRPYQWRIVREDGDRPVPTATA